MADDTEVKLLKKDVLDNKSKIGKHSDKFSVLETAVNANKIILQRVEDKLDKVIEERHGKKVAVMGEKVIGSDNKIKKLENRIKEYRDDFKHFKDTDFSNLKEQQRENSDKLALVLSCLAILIIIVQMFVGLDMSDAIRLLNTAF